MKKTMDANQIKLLAILAMTIDHIAWLVFPGYSKAPLALLMHLIGRMTCPIMCFFIAEGYYHTRDLNRYTLRLFVFAVISHFAYIFASQDFVDARSFIPFYYGGILNQTSVMWSLAWGLVMLRVANHPGYSQLKKTLLVVLICLVSFERLELHREPLRARVRHEPRGSEGAGAVAAVLRGAVCGGVLLRAGHGLWASADGGSAVAAGARAL